MIPSLNAKARKEPPKTFRLPSILHPGRGRSTKRESQSKREKEKRKKKKGRKEREIAREMVIEAEGGGASARQISSRYTNIPFVGSQRSHPRFFPGNYVFALPGVAKFKVSLVRIARRASWSEMGRVPEEGRKTRSSQREQNARACECVQFNDFQPEFR